MNDPKGSRAAHGDRRTLIALHCSGAGGRAFDCYRSLVGPATQLVAPDLIGYAAGAPPWPAAASASLDDEAGQLEPWLRGAEGGADLLGHSYGGAVALQVALRWPHRVRSLTLFEPARFALLRADHAPWQAITRVGRSVAELVMQGRPNDAAETFVDYWGRSGTWATLPPNRQAAVAAKMSKVCAEFEAAFADRTLPTAYRRLTMPVTVIVGGQSPVPARRVAERLADACPHVRLVRAPQLGHMGALEDPEVVVRALPWTTGDLGLAA